MTPTAAAEHGYARVDKHPKSSRYGRQNPITARWNSEEQLVAWREAWVDMANRAIEQAEIGEQIDHRSHAARGFDEQPTIHEDVEAMHIEEKGFVSERRALNRQIRADNALLRELKEQIRQLSIRMQRKRNLWRAVFADADDGQPEASGASYKGERRFQKEKRATGTCERVNTMSLRDDKNKWIEAILRVLAYVTLLLRFARIILSKIMS